MLIAVDRNCVELRLGSDAKASKLAVSSLLLRETYTSVVLCRDLHMFTGGDCQHFPTEATEALLWSWFASWSIRSHTASIKDCLVYLVGTPSCHIESYRVISSQSCVFSPCFLPGDSGCLGMQAIPWSWRCTRMLCWQLCSLQGRGGQSENRFVRIDAGNLNSYIINQINLFRSFMFNQIKILINLGPSNSF